MGKLILNRVYWGLPILFWIALALLSLSWNLTDIGKHREELVTNRARLIFKMVESIRLWNTNHGSVSTQLGATTPTDPLSGRESTPVNPACLTRQLAVVVDDITGAQVRLTSLKPLNPDNQAAPWEAKALQLFENERGHTEWSEFRRDENGKEQYRYIAPLATRQACLECHGSQGYKEGDIRGAISITFPPGPLLSPIDHQYRNQIAIHLGILLLLIALSLLFLKYLRRQLLVLESTRTEQEHLLEQRTAELRLEALQSEEAERRLRGFIESSGEGIFAIDAHGRFTLANPAALKLLGYAEEASLLGRSVHELLCPCQEKAPSAPAEPCGDCAIHCSYSAGIAQHQESACFRRADGTSIPVEYRSQPLLNATERHGAVITFADISERLAREQQLRKLSNALEHSPVAALITDRAGHIEYVNQRFVEESGYRAEELLGHTPGLLKSGQTPSATYASMWEHLRRGEPWHGELLNRKKSGELFWEETAIAPITDERGQVINYVAFKEDVTRRKKEEDRVWHQANFDSLTGLSNRSHFMDKLQHHTSEAQRYQRKFALMFIDLDGFKQVNDSLGHDGGDELLQQCAQRLRDCTRSSDLVSRLGGDEFTVIIPVFKSLDDLKQVAQKLLERLAQPYLIKGQEVYVSASLGIATYPADAADFNALFRNADSAMYEAKHHGKNRFSFYTATPDS